MMDIRKILSDIEEKDMHYLGDYYEEMMNLLHKGHPELYNKYLIKTYALAYGCEMNEELAKMKVSEMKPHGEHWTLEQTTSVGKGAGVDFTQVKPCTFYYVMNMLYNDYATVLGSDANMYIKMSKAWLEDVDSPYDGNEKTFRYAMM